MNRLVIVPVLIAILFCQISCATAGKNDISWRVDSLKQIEEKKVLLRFSTIRDEVNLDDRAHTYTSVIKYLGPPVDIIRGDDHVDIDKRTYVKLIWSTNKLNMAIAFNEAGYAYMSFIGRNY